MLSRPDRRLYGLGGREGSAKGEGNLAGRLTHLVALQPWPGGRLLDVGCGNGAYTLRLAGHFDTVLGVDIEPERLDDLREAIPAHPHGDRVTVLQRSATDLPLEVAHLDAVTAIETVEHLGRHLEATLAETARVLRPGGTFYLTTPNRWWPLEQHGFNLGSRHLSGVLLPFLTWVPALHRRLSPNDAFTPRRLDRLIEPHGFRRTGLRLMWPPLDGHPVLHRVLAPLFGLASRTPLRRFAQTLVMTYERL